MSGEPSVQVGPANTRYMHIRQRRQKYIARITTMLDTLGTPHARLGMDAADPPIICPKCGKNPTEKWWEDYRARVKEEIKARPLSDAISRTTFLVPSKTESAAYQLCPSCPWAVIPFPTAHQLSELFEGLEVELDCKSKGRHCIGVIAC